MPLSCSSSIRDETEGRREAWDGEGGLLELLVVDTKRRFLIFDEACCLLVENLAIFKCASW